MPGKGRQRTQNRQEGYGRDRDDGHGYWWPGRVTEHHCSHDDRHGAAADATRLVVKSLMANTLGVTRVVGEQEPLSHQHIWAPLRPGRGGGNRNGAGGLRAADSEVPVMSEGDSGSGFFSRGESPPNKGGGKGRKEAETERISAKLLRAPGKQPSSSSS